MRASRELTGICDDDLKDAPVLDTVLPELLAFCGELPLLGHHVIFDFSFLKRAAVNRKYTFEHAGLDTLKICRHFMPEEEKKNLAAACRYFAVDPGESHRALSDALAAHHLYQELKNRYFLEVPEVFAPQPLIYKVKREQPASKKQKEVLRELLKYHRINLSAQIDSLSKNEISETYGSDYCAAWQNAEEVRDMFKFSNQKTRQIVSAVVIIIVVVAMVAGTILAGLMM